MKGSNRTLTTLHNHEQACIANLKRTHLALLNPTCRPLIIDGREKSVQTPKLSMTCLLFHLLASSLWGWDNGGVTSLSRNNLMLTVITQKGATCLEFVNGESDFWAILSGILIELGHRPRSKACTYSSCRGRVRQIGKDQPSLNKDKAKG